jgi:transcriptional regulator with XRE-family HTH domain
MKKNKKTRKLLIPQRIRNRRKALGLAGYELAERAGLSPSYLSLIEKGKKIPSVEVAVRIAEALGDVPALYRAWVYASRYPDLSSDTDSLQQLQAAESSPDLHAKLRRGEELEDEVSGEHDLTFSAKSAEPPARVVRLLDASRRKLMALRRAEEAKLSAEAREERFDLVQAGDTVHDFMMEPAELSRVEAPSTIEVPLLPDGADPGEEPMEFEGILGVLRLDQQLLPVGIDRPFAYRPGESFVERVRDSINPGDVVVLAAVPDTVDPAGIYAVRRGGRVVLSRVVRSGTILLLLPSVEGESPVSIECRDERGLRERLVGAVVLTTRSWGMSRSRGDLTAVAAAPRGRSVRLEGEFLVRDCEWKDRYGWRPIQRPEDLDYLEAHPGTKIRFRLIRDGRVKYLLEMSPEEWRGALGDYVEVHRCDYEESERGVYGGVSGEVGGDG